MNWPSRLLLFGARLRWISESSVSSVPPYANSRTVRGRWPPALSLSALASHIYRQSPLLSGMSRLLYGFLTLMMVSLPMFLGLFES